MSTRVVLAWMFVCTILPVSSHAVVSKHHADPKAATTKHDARPPNPCRSSLLEIQSIYDGDKVPASARKQLVERLNCLRDYEMASASDGDEHEIQTLEGMAKDDLQRLTDVTIPSLEKAKSAGVDVDKALSEMRLALLYLSSIVAISKEGKAELKPSHFLDLRATNDVTKTRTACVDPEKPLPIKDVPDVQVCLDELATKIAAAHGDASAFLRNRRELVEDRGARISASKAEKLKEFHDKRDAAKTPAEKETIDKQLKTIEQDLKTLEQIAIAPASRRTCLQSSPPRPDDRCPLSAALLR